MSTRMQSIASMNNAAALLIEQGQYNLALGMLADSLANVQHEVECLAADDSFSSFHSDIQQPSVVYRPTSVSMYPSLEAQRIHEEGRHASVHCDSRDQSTSPSRSSSYAHQKSPCGGGGEVQRMMEEESDRDFVYRHPIQANLELANDAENGVYILSVIIVFNLGLVHHLMALEDHLHLQEHHQDGDNDNELPPPTADDEDGGDHHSNNERRSRTSPYFQHLESALRLYKLGFEMQMKGCVSLDVTYAMAMVNNCASIYSALNRRRRAEKFYFHLLSSLLFLVENGEAENIDELDGFLTNTSRLILRKNIAAAAA